MAVIELVVIQQLFGSEPEELWLDQGDVAALLIVAVTERGHRLVMVVVSHQLLLLHLDTHSMRNQRRISNKQRPLSVHMVHIAVVAIISSMVIFDFILSLFAMLGILSKTRRFRASSDRVLVPLIPFGLGMDINMVRLSVPPLL